VAQKELDLFQLTTRNAAEAGTRPAKVVRREVGYASSRSELFNDMPGKLLGDAVSPGLASATDSTKHLARIDCSGFDPCSEFVTDPVWNRDRPDVAAFAAQVYDRPMPFPLLEVIDSQLGYLVPPEATRKQ
jgi:hypothetical protein